MRDDEKGLPENDTYRYSVLLSLSIYLPNRGRVKFLFRNEQILAVMRGRIRL